VRCGGTESRRKKQFEFATKSEEFMHKCGWNKNRKKRIEKKVGAQVR
jgi:hypothetical protein